MPADPGGRKVSRHPDGNGYPPPADRDFWSGRPSQHVEVEVEDRFGILAEVAAIFGQHRTNINSVMLERSQKEDHLNIVFRILAKDLGKIIDNIEQAGHRVLWPRTNPDPEGGV